VVIDLNLAKRAVTAIGGRTKQTAFAVMTDRLDARDMNEIIYGNRLLIVDDEPAYGNLIAKVAQGSGYEVIVTNDPRGCGRTTRSWSPTVIMLDLQMPGMDGVELLRGLAADQCAAHIVISSGAEEKILDAAMRLGHERGLTMSGVLAKPVRVKKLREMLAGFKRVPRELLASDLAEAIASDRLYLEYQPKFDCRERRFTGVEALARWHHPERGAVRPDEFVSLAEETGLIHDLTDWVVGTAARQAALWQAAGLDLAIAVNISALDIEDLDLPERLATRCAEAGIDPSSVILELTETGAMRHPAQMMDVLTRLRLKDFRVSIDDFGTGYSSLVQLQRLPFSEMKIDKSFVLYLLRDHGCRAIAEIIVELARRLKLTSVAEGVEDAATLDALIAMGCETAQGYYLSRPVPAEQVTELFREQRCRERAYRPTADRGGELRISRTSRSP
jgi:EAL domain-containing protein (putative c-di-GMP-specific phosphodiesterase class I)